MHVGSKTFGDVNLKFSKLKCNLHFLPRGLNIGLIRFCVRARIWYDTRYAQDRRQGVAVFHNLDADAISEVYISVNRKIGQRVKYCRCSRVVSLRCQFSFRHSTA